MIGLGFTIAMQRLSRTAPTFKLIGNSLILGSLEILAESFTLGEKSGISSDLVQTLVKDLMPAPM